MHDEFTRRPALLRIGIASACLLGFGAFGCEQLATEAPGNVSAPLAAYRARMAEEQAASDRQPATARPVSWQEDLPEREALVAQPPLPEVSPAEVLSEIPDPTEAPEVFRGRLARLREGPRPDDRVVNTYAQIVEVALDKLEQIDRPVQVPLTLQECIQRALEYNYAIRVEAYNPAISQTQIVEAEAAFDAEFFLDNTFWDKQDQATASTFVPGTGDTRAGRAGFRQLLPTGMQVETALSAQRQGNDLPEQFQTLNPVYNNAFTVSFTQPLLRNFGLEVNRSQIQIRRAEFDIAYEQFVQQVRDTLLDVETAYWRLMQARRVAAVQAEIVAQNYITYLGIKDRLQHDATQVELNNSLSRWQRREVAFQEAVRNVRDAEDALKNLLNDPKLRLSDDLELVPVTTPVAAPLAVDQLAAARRSLDSRSEIRAARRGIDQTRIQTAVAKNQTLPQLDLSFQYEVTGIGNTFDNSFDNLTTARFISYTVSIVFSYPIGNRGPMAALRRARLQESQAVVNLYRIMDSIVQEVNNAVRTLQVRYAQIAPQLESVQAAERNLRALQARTQRIDPSFLETELNAVEQLANTRTTLAQIIADYNVAVVSLERAKGTLLDYNNVVVTDEPPEF